MSMAVVNTNTTYLVDNETPEDAAKRTIGRIADYINCIEPALDQVIVAIYPRVEKIGSIILPDSVTQENIWQGKVGIIVKMGPDAFVDDSSNNIEYKLKAKVGDWVYFSVQDGWISQIAGMFVRNLRARSIKGTLTRPDVIY